jgi:hypothetical protein
MQADPADSVAAFTEYAADRLWVASHLTQLAGITLMDAALLILTRQMQVGQRKTWSYLAAGSAIAGLAVAAALQAVDGIALKAMVNAWVTAPPAQKEMAFLAAFAIRQVEIGLASMLSLLFGLTACLYGLALYRDRTCPRWVAGLAIVGGFPTMVGGLFMAYTGFSNTAMAINMPANFLLLAWMFTIGIVMWRQAKIQ